MENQLNQSQFRIVKRGDAFVVQRLLRELVEPKFCPLKKDKYDTDWKNLDENGIYYHFKYFVFKSTTMLYADFDSATRAIEKFIHESIPVKDQIFELDGNSYKPNH